LFLPEYAEAFCDNAIDAAVLPELAAEDLKYLCVRLFGHRCKLSPQSRSYAAILFRYSTHRWPRAPSNAGQLTVMLCAPVGSTELDARSVPRDLRVVHHRVRDRAAARIYELTKQDKLANDVFPR
jgi:SAM domain (Sterile alpha motif)